MCSYHWSELGDYCLKWAFSYIWRSCINRLSDICCPRRAFSSSLSFASFHITRTLERQRNWLESGAPARMLWISECKQLNRTIAPVRAASRTMGRSVRDCHTLARSCLCRRRLWMNDRDATRVVDSVQIEATTIGAPLYFDCNSNRHLDVAKHVVVVFTWWGCQYRIDNTIPTNSRAEGRKRFLPRWKLLIWDSSSLYTVISRYKQSVVYKEWRKIEVKREDDASQPSELSFTGLCSRGQFFY